MLAIRRYHRADHDEVWNLHILGLQLVGAYADNGPWDNDLHANAGIMCPYNRKT